MATAMEAASQNRSPPQYAPSEQPTSLPRQATAMTSASISPAAQRPQVDPQPDDAEEDRRQHAEGERLEAGDGLLAQRAAPGAAPSPATKAPKTGWTPILSVSARAQEGDDDDEHQVRVVGLEALASPPGRRRAGSGRG